MLHALRHSTGRRLENRFTALEVRLPCRLRMPSWDIRAWRCTTPRVALHFLKATHARTGTWLLHMPRWRKRRPSPAMRNCTPVIMRWRRSGDRRSMDPKTGASLWRVSREGELLASSACDWIIAESAYL